ncbi:MULTISPECIES: flagellin [unclassified Paenibacillus]|uniref:flagellin N-terminal helical domain-containing protein n=1 Tax=unclassified Paenibacillus TaxID=185978 RepID=UPI001AE3677C|nr:MULTISPECIES: flagellin [unclassified Paenibacillus]MBP1155150.1 flagellin [Paenibacillus sp. PvP091]MBP1169466.1 flagellin [Paenibacillus sp. PvR098]MBP2440494.1 flagellin [Paenibacillus sp. PvP052]
MRINHNISALNSYNREQTNNKGVLNSTQRISSGLRINQAADDSAGLSISEKMKGQIRGLEQAERNIQDGISLIHTAEGGLSQIQNPLIQRLRELAIQASNGTLTSHDRQAIQMEIDQIKQNINDIANNTEFNSIKLLQPPVIQGNSGSPSGQKADIIFFIDDSSTMQEEINHVTAGISDFVSNLSAYGDVRVGTVSTVHSGRNLPLTSDVAMIQNHLSNVHIATPGGSTPYQHMINYAPNGSQGSSLGYDSSSKKIFVLLTDTNNESTVVTELDVKSALESDNINSYVFGLNLGASTNSFSQSTAYDDFAKQIFIPATAADIAANISPGLANQIVADTGFGQEESSLKPIHLQVGPNSGDDFIIHLFDARTTNLGIDDILVDPIGKAQEAIEKLDKALETVSSERVKFGAYQNVLEHIKNNVSNYKSNITASESQIRDADLPKEILNLTNKKIVLESSHVMLTQANQMTQSVLQFLK